MPGPPQEPIKLTVDLTIFGDASTIETRVPRSVYGSLHVGDIVAVIDDSSEPQLYQVSALTNGGRDVRLRAVHDLDTPSPQGTENGASTSTGEARRPCRPRLTRRPDRATVTQEPTGGVR